MRRDDGFTLVELLVVIAIIAILAGIVIPNVPKYINKARGTRAFAEVKGIDLALTKMLTDANRNDFRSGFFASWPAPGADILAARDVYTQAFYVLLRKGKGAESDSYFQSQGITLNPEVRRNLGDSYMDLGKDPWGNLYNFWAGPWSQQVQSMWDGLNGEIPFRIYSVDLTVPGGPSQNEAIGVDITDRESASGTEFPVGFPASRKQTVYVWSNGANRVSNQWGLGTCGLHYDDFDSDFLGGGDDINNWDNAQSWQGFYN